MDSYKPIFQALHDAQLKYLVVGGIAVNLHGYPRFTGDVDILLALDHDNLRKMHDLMEKMHYERRVPVDIQDLDDEAKVREWMETKNLSAYTFVNPTHPQFSIDIIVGDSLKFGEYDGRKMLVEMWDLSIPVVSIDDLIAMKRKIDREYLRLCKKSSPEQKLDWLSAAHELVQECARARLKRLQRADN